MYVIDLRNGLLAAAIWGALALGCSSEPERLARPKPGGANPRVMAHASTTPARAQPAPPSVREIEPRIPDIVLLDQDGKQRRLYTDLIKGKQVLMNAIYTARPDTYPVQAHIFSEVQQVLGDRLGQDVHMISVSLDPLTDTPQRLREFAERYEARPGWVFLTGSREDVTRALRAMGLYVADPRAHTPIAVLGNEPTGVWMKTINLTSPLEIVKKLDHLASLNMDEIVRK